ncbi:S-adenosyl-L-methionine-dependent methyltransferase [Geopyxis carbonaria]|nr:S-adenosyl-L-methionine-dependent methyltransferase [Geopyxis carbonaria]
MSLYIEANQILSQENGSLKSRIYNENPSTYRSPPKRLYALIVETLKHQDILNEVIEKSGLLEVERKLTHSLALLLLHDHLLNKSGIATSSGPLKSSILKHKGRISAEFIKARLRRGYGTSAQYVAAVELELDSKKLPRWVRVNTLKKTVDQVLNEGFKEYNRVADFSQVLKEKNTVYIDKFIPSLVAFPPSIDLSQHPLYVSGALIIQDRSSCFPAYLLSPPCNSFVIDGTAAPGNKTTHLAAILGQKTSGKIFAFEKDTRRAEILKRMVGKAGGSALIELRAGSDFLKSNPKENGLQDVTHILLDPSCSGSGIVGREEYTLERPPATPAPTKGKKRKRTEHPQPQSMIKITHDDEVEEEDNSIADEKRLSLLSDFQKNIIQHAMTYPSAEKITYSTCSIYHQENEDVVTSILTSAVALKRGWTVERRENGTLKDWPRRGLREFCESDEVAEACIRCNPLEDGGIGFFVVAFIRNRTENEEDISTEIFEDGTQSDKELDDEEWAGFSDSEPEATTVCLPLPKNASNSKKKRKSA